MTRYAPLRERFDARVDRSAGPDACWPWTGSGGRARGGGVYGHIKAGPIIHTTHRLAWEYANGPIPDGLMVLHRCYNPPCCNPAHLFLGTALDNNRDREAKGRGVNVRPFGSGAANPQARLTEAQVREIRRLVGSMSNGAIGRRFGVAPQTVSKIATGKRWANVPLVGEKGAA